MRPQLVPAYYHRHSGSSLVTYVAHVVVRSAVYRALWSLPFPVYLVIVVVAVAYLLYGRCRRT